MYRGTLHHVHSLNAVMKMQVDAFARLDSAMTVMAGAR
jgi:hypothetical protein